MKKIRKVLSCLAVLSMMICIYACTAVDFQEEDTHADYTLNVVTRTSQTSQLTYPIKVFAFNEKGKLESTQILNNESDKLFFKLSKGDYNLVAIANYTTYSCPENPQYSDYISLLSEKTSSPLLMGSASLSLNSSSQTVNLTLSYVVSDVTVRLKDVPVDANKVSISFSKTYSELSFSGKLDAPSLSTIDCVKKDGDWIVEHLYLFGTETNANIGINITTSLGTETYSYNFSSGIKAGYPYEFIGSYQSGLSMNGTLSSSDWMPSVQVKFNFGTDVTDDVTLIKVSEIPKENSIFQNHLVVKTSYNSNNEADLLLMSLQEWKNMTSAFYSSDPNASERVIASYSEQELSNWRTPTKEEAQYLKSKYSDTDLVNLNQTLSSANGDIISTTDEKGNNVRYLCEESTYSFAFISSSALSKAGSTVKTYHLRLVKTVHIVKE